MTQPQPQPLDLDAIALRVFAATDPASCGTCRRLTSQGQPAEHTACRRRAVLLPAPDAPDYEDLADLTDEQRQALPPRFHTPTYDGDKTPAGWLCAVCWGDGWVTSWPCAVASKQGGEVFTAEHHAERARADVYALANGVHGLTVELDRLRAERAGRRDQVLTEAAGHLERIADETEARVAEHYGPASGIGPGSADMVREAARSVRALVSRTTTAQEG